MEDRCFQRFLMTMNLSIISLFLTLLPFSAGRLLRRDSASSVVLLDQRQNSSCENTATSRECWGDYSIDTDYYTVTPDTGVTREVNVFPCGSSDLLI